jgi:hypothetical protein
MSFLSEQQGAFYYFLHTHSIVTSKVTKRQILKVKTPSKMQWWMSVVPVTCGAVGGEGLAAAEAEAGTPLEPRSWKPTWATEQDPALKKIKIVGNPLSHSHTHTPGTSRRGG